MRHWFVLLLATSVGGAEAAGLAVQESLDRVVFTLDGKALCEFRFRDEMVRRPCFTNVVAPSGTKVTRQFPPVAGQDAMDHRDMHPGIWLAFGDVSGNDFWRNKATIRHEGFLQPPAVVAGSATFVHQATLLDSAGAAMAKLESRCSLISVGAGVLLDWRARFEPLIDGFAFGDQEEMGFGVRMAGNLTEKAGGELVSSEGLTGASRTWGRRAAWCDYSAVVNGTRVGIAIFPHPTNFRESWWHNRDYGLFVANPFGRRAMKQGELSRVTVGRNESFTLRFGAYIHSAPAGAKSDIPQVYATYCSQE